MSVAKVFSSEGRFWLRCGAGMFLFFTVVFLLLAFPSAAAQGVADGVALSLQTLVPSMLPMLVLTSFFSRSDLGLQTAKLLETPTRVLLGFPGGAAAVLLFSLLGGYPVGAATIVAGVSGGTLSRRDGQLLQLFCFCPTPAFVLSAVGVGMLNSPRAGRLLYVSVVGASLLLGVAARFLRKGDDFLSGVAPQPETDAAAFVNAVTDGAQSMLHICAFVCLFSVVPPLLTQFPLPALVNLLVPAVLEVTTGCRSLCGVAALPWVAALLGFGGVCSHCQLLPALVRLRLPLWQFFLARVLHGGLAAALCAVLCHFFPVETAVLFQQTPRFAPSAASSAAVSVCLVSMCVLLLLGSNVKLRLGGKSEG